MLCIQSRLPQNTSGFLPDMNAQIGALNDLFPLVIALNSWTGGKLSKVNYQRSFIQISPYNINLVLPYLMSPCLVPRHHLHHRNFRLADDTFYSRRFIHVVHVGSAASPFITHFGGSMGTVCKERTEFQQGPISCQNARGIGSIAVTSEGINHINTCVTA